MWMPWGEWDLMPGDIVRPGYAAHVEGTPVRERGDGIECESW